MSESMLTATRRLFYERGGPWYRCRAAELLGSRRYSQPALFGMDRRLAELFGGRAGTFVEAGAHDGYTQSNTYYLERFLGWRGVLVEPVPRLAARCARRRPRARVFNCALVGEAEPGELAEIHFGDLMSTLDPEAVPADVRRRYSAAVPARTLSSVLDEAGVADLDVLILDVEGREADVLRGLDLERHAPAYMLLEALEIETARPRYAALLEPRYELVEDFSSYDLLFRRTAGPR